MVLVWRHQLIPSEANQLFQFHPPLHLIDYTVHNTVTLAFRYNYVLSLSPVSFHHMIMGYAPAALQLDGKASLLGSDGTGRYLKALVFL